MKKIIMFVAAIIFVASILLTKVNKKEKMSDITLANVEALAQTEDSNHYICYGTGKVTCPYTGQQVAGYFKRLNLE